MILYDRDAGGQFMYRSSIGSISFFFVLILVSISCSVRSENVPTGNEINTVSPTAAQPEAGSGKAVIDQQIRKIDFKNFTYEPECASEDVRKITVKNGEFSSEKQEEGYVDRFYFNVIAISYGDLNGDNSEEAIILTNCNTGGTGQFTEGFVYTLKDGKPALFSRIPGGDRAYGGLRAARVENGQLVVEANDVGPEGGACCPEFVVTTRYDVSSGKLKQIGKPDKRNLFPSQRVTFAKGTTGTTIDVKIPPQEGKRYVVGARAGQILDVSVNTDKASLRLLEDAEITEDTNGFSATLPKSGDYTIEVTNYLTTAINVQINIRIR
jgi:hypothetical protein